MAMTWGATYHVDVRGDDAAEGTEQAPWRTIQRAVQSAQPGDTVLVHSGVYPERITTIRGGSSEDARIRFKAMGTVEMRGFIINHPYVTVEGFDITGHSAAQNLDAYVRVNNGGYGFELLACTIRDGMAIKRNDIEFVPPDRIRSPAGGFLQAGFHPGQTILVMRGTNQTVANAGSFLVAEVTDTELRLTSQTIQAEGPKPVYISGSAQYGLLTGSGTANCRFRSNRLSNLSYRYVFLQGVGHRFEYNVIENNNGWDLLFWTGTNHIVQGNWFRNLGWGVYEPSPDIFDNWPVRYENIWFTNNFVQNVIGVINAQKRNGTVSGPLFICHNVFIDIGWLNVVFPNTVIAHNTFLRVAKRSNVAVQRESHPIIVDAQNYATNVVIQNNLFVDCGQPAGAVSEDQVGWYRFIGSSESAVLGGNFVAGGPPLYAAKSSWPESPDLNGGDPGFRNVDDPLGPDGVPFTADDGLRLRADSRLLGAGVGGATIGAYELPYVESVTLDIVRLNDREVGIRWPRSIWNWTVEWAPNPQGPWSVVARPVETTESGWQVRVPAEEPGMWFRLRR